MAREFELREAATETGACPDAPGLPATVVTEIREMTPEAYERIQSLCGEVYASEDYHEGLRAFTEKRRAEFLGS